MTISEPNPLPEGAKFNPAISPESLRKAHREGKLLQVAKARDGAGGFIDVYATPAFGERFGQSGCLYLLDVALRRLVRKDADGRKTIGKGVLLLDAARVVSYGVAIVISYAEEPIPE